MLRVAGVPLALLVACGGGSSSTEITSDDGTATLTIPDGALPDDVSADDIVITRDDALVDDPDDATMVWRFEPDGLVFLKPATLRLKVDVPGGEFFGIRHSSEDLTAFVSLVPDTETSIISDDGTLSEAVVQIEHFSRTEFFRYGNETTRKKAIIEWAPKPGDTTLNGPIVGAIRVEVPDSITRVGAYVDSLGTDPFIDEFNATLRPWQIDFEYRTTGTNPDDPTGTVMASEVIHDEPLDLTCVEPEYLVNPKTTVTMFGSASWLDDMGRPTSVFDNNIMIQAYDRQLANGNCTEGSSTLSGDDPADDWSETCSDFEAEAGPPAMDILHMEVEGAGQNINTTIDFNGDNKLFLEGADPKPNLVVQIYYAGSGYLEVFLQPDCTVKVVDNKADGSVEWLNDGQSIRIGLDNAPFSLADIEYVIGSTFNYDVFGSTYCDDIRVP